MRLAQTAPPQHLPCKVCTSPSGLYGVVDFSKTCGIRNDIRPLLSGHPVYYRRCGTCGFLFTDAFDGWELGEFLEFIYNDQYAVIDPDYHTIRPTNSAAMLMNLFGTQRTSLSILDYGCGNGKTVEILRTGGFTACEGFDPFTPAFAKKPSRTFNVILSVETLEHVVDQNEFVRDIDSLAAEASLILFTTLLQPVNFDEIGLGWWYVAPRNGHISMHSRLSLRRLWNDRGYTVVSHNENLHVAFRKIPEFATSIIKVTG